MGTDNIMTQTKYDLILQAIREVNEKQADVSDLCELVGRHHKTLYGNGEEGLCESIRGIRKDITDMKEVIHSKRDERRAADSEGITFKWLTEKVILPVLWPLILVVVMAAYIIQNYVK